jgi:tRNA threonylcarbamoyladenosine biosynthesis protein TsaE
MLMETTVTKDELQAVAYKLIKKVHSLKSDTATVIAFWGELGSGKTTLTQEIAKILGVKESVISPTFVIMKKYKTSDKKFTQLIHIDAYRLNKSSELLHLGWQELLEDKNNLIIVEWPGNVPECIPDNACHLELSHDKEHTRNIKFKG